MKYEEIVAWLENLKNPEAVRGMARFGIHAAEVYGVSIPILREKAREIPRNHELALKLWSHPSRETRILASMVERLENVAELQLEAWVKDFDSWELCDQVCMNLFEKYAAAYTKAKQWSLRQEEFVKRAGFVLMARLAVSDKTAPHSRFEQFFSDIEREADDGRIVVKKAVNWALRQIGKRHFSLNRAAVQCAERVQAQGTSSARWIASDALRELRSDAVQNRLAKKAREEDK